MSGIFEVELPGGRIIEVEGAPDADSARARVRSLLQEERRNAPRDGSALARGFHELEGNLFSAVEGTGNLTGLDFMSRFGREGRVRSEAAAERAQPSAQRQSFEDAETVGDYTRAGLQAIGTNTPNMGLSLGAMIAGGMLAGPPGAIAAGLIANYPQLFGSNRQRQMQERPGQPVSEGAAALTAIPQAALDTVSDRILMGLGRAMGAGRAANDVGRDLGMRIAHGLGVGAVTEVPTEVLQQAMERAQAGLDVLSPDAMREYRETALASAVTGGAAGATIGGVAGPRPEVPPPPPPPPAPVATPPVSPLPDPPEPIVDLAAATALIGANPEFTPPAGTTDEGVIVRANDILRAQYRDKVAEVRSQFLSDFMGAGNIVTRPGEIDEAGLQGPDVRDYGRAAPTVIRNVLDAQGRGLLAGSRFTVNQVADLAMEPLGLPGNSITREEKAAIKEQLDGMVASGFLVRSGKAGYEVAPRPVSPRGQPGDAPPTAEQAAVPKVLAALQTLTANPTQANQKAVLALAKDTQLAPEVAEYLGLMQAARVIEVQKRQLTGNRPEEAATLVEMEDKLQDIVNRQAEIMESLEGRAAGTLAAANETPAEFTTQVGLSQPALPPTGSDAAAIAEQSRLNAEAAAADPAFQMRDQRQIAQAIQQRPEEVDSLLRSLIGLRPPGSRLDAAAIQATAASLGIPIDNMTAIQLYNHARMRGLINQLGMIPPAKATPAVASTPPVASPPAPKKSKATKPAPTTTSTAAAIEMPTAEDLNVLWAFGATNSELHNYADPRWHQDPGNRSHYERTLADAKAGKIWWRGNIVPADQTVLDQANEGHATLKQWADAVAAKVAKAFDGKSADTKLANVLGSDYPAMTRAESLDYIRRQLISSQATIGRITKQIERSPAPEAKPDNGSFVNDQDFDEDHAGPAFEESYEAEASYDDERDAGDINFAAPQLRQRPESLPGLDIQDDGSFDYTNEVDGGVVNITGRIENGAMIVQTARATRTIQGQGFGIQSYLNLVDFAHANGLDFKSDVLVSDAASNVYKAMARRGYEVERAPANILYRAGDSWISEDDNQSVWTVPAPYKYAAPETSINAPPQDRDAAAATAEATFKKVLGANGRLTVQDRVFISQLGDEIKAAAEKAKVPLNHDEISGVAIGDLAILSLRDQGMPIDQVAIHEGFHIAENLGLFTPNELAVINGSLPQIEALIRKQLPYAPAYLPPQEIRAYGINARVAQRADFGSLINQIFDKFTNFVERIGNFVRGQGFQTWRDVYDAFTEGGMADRTATRPVAADPQIDFVAGPRLTGAPGETAKVQRANVDQITGFMRWFGSPVMSMGKVKPELQAAADTQRTLYTRANEMIGETETLLNPAHRLPPASVARITRVWETASRTKKAPNTTGLNEEEKAALQGEMAAVQRALDYFIESASIDHFLPSPSKPAAINSRLEAFWQRHSEKHLWEIPQRELMAASPEGFMAMQKFERLRNPSYMPMMSQGTHFVAAYKKKPGGGRGELVGLVSYQPRNMIQRFRNFADPLQDAVAQLKAEFDPARHIIMEEGRQFTHDADVKKLRDEGDFIASYLNRLGEATGGNQNAQRIIREMTQQIDKAQMERIFRPNRDILRAVTPANESSYILDTMPKYILSMSKVQARRFTQEPYKRATQALSPNDQAFLDELRDYSTTPSEAFGNARAAAFFMYLGGAIDTALINATQNFHTAAFLIRDGDMAALPILGRTMKELALSSNVKQLTADTTTFLSKFKTKLPPAELAALERAEAEGIFAPVFTNESRSQFTIAGLRKAGFKNPEAAHKTLTKISRIAGTPMQIVEEFNRAAAFLSAFRLATEIPDAMRRANHIDGTDFKSPYDYAVGKVIDSQYLTTKEDRAYIQRFTPSAEVMTQFMSYPLKTIEQYIRAGGQIVEGLRNSDPVAAKAGAVMLLGMAGPLIALGGLWALPFADSLKEWAELLVRTVWGTTANFDAEMREMLGGGQFAEAIIRGIPHATGVVSLSRRLAVDPVPASDIVGASPIALFGPVGGFAEIPARAFQYYNNGDYWQLAASVMPRAVGNVIRGLQLAVDQEQYTLRGNRVITPQDVERADGRHMVPHQSAVRQALGFPPPEFVNMREMVSRAEEINRATRTMSERHNKELTGIMVNMMDANRVGDSATAAREQRRFSERLQTIMNAQEGRPPHLRYNPNMSSLTQQAIMDFYGISSLEAQSRTGRAAARPEILRQREMLDWRNPRREGFAGGGLVEAGNTDLKGRTEHANPDGSISTVRSMSIGTPQGEVLIPTIRRDGHAMTEAEAIREYMRSGRHLGIFSSQEEANEYAQFLHKRESARWNRPGPGVERPN